MEEYVRVSVSAEDRLGAALINSAVRYVGEKRSLAIVVGTTFFFVGLFGAWLGLVLGLQEYLGVESVPLAVLGVTMALSVVVGSYLAAGTASLMYASVTDHGFEVLRWTRALGTGVTVVGFGFLSIVLVGNGVDGDTGFLAVGAGLAVFDVVLARRIRRRLSGDDESDPEADSSDGYDAVRRFR